MGVKAVTERRLAWALTHHELSAIEHCDTLLSPLGTHGSARVIRTRYERFLLLCTFILAGLLSYPPSHKSGTCHIIWRGGVLHVLSLLRTQLIGFFQPGSYLTPSALVKYIRLTARSLSAGVKRPWQLGEPFYGIEGYVGIDQHD